MSLQKTLFILLAVFALSACGPNLKTITLITPIPVMNPTKDLSKVFSQMSGITNPNGTLGVGNLANACIQNNFSVLTQWGGEGSPINPKKFQIQTEILPYAHGLGNQSSNSNEHVATDWLNSHSALTGPITISVPGDQAFTVAIRGILEDPQNSNIPGTPCKNALDTGRNPFLVYERKDFAPSSGNTLTLRPNVLKAAGTAELSFAYPLGPPGGPVNNYNGNIDIKCRDYSNSKSCANIDVLSFFFSAALTGEITAALNGSKSIRLRQALSELDEAITLSLSVDNYAYTNTLRNYIISYTSGPNNFTVVLDPKAHTLSYFTGISSTGASSTPTIQNLYSCGGYFFGSLPRSSNLTPSAVNNCSTGYNFKIRDLGQGF
jgi:hypothetical protein